MTWYARNKGSAIDYMLVNGRMHEIVDCMWTDEDGMIDVVLDHNMLVLECKLNVRDRTNAKAKRRKWTLRDVGLENFRVDLSERNWEDESLNGVDKMNDRFVENERDAAAS